MVDGTGLENRRGATHRGFESLPLRQFDAKAYLKAFCFLQEGICGLQGLITIATPKYLIFIPNQLLY